MIFDQQNMFFDKKASASVSDVIANVGGGDAADPLFLVMHADTAQTATLSVALQTDDAENFSNAVTLATYSVPVGGVGIVISAKLPYGVKKFLRLSVTASGSESAAVVGKLTAGLTETVPNWKF